jgi:hypothetical protein
MSSYPNWIFNTGLAPIWRRVERSLLGKRTLGAWTTMIFARLKDLAPYAVIELLLPGGSVFALTLWFYRRRKRVPALSETKVAQAGIVVRAST